MKRSKKGVTLVELIICCGIIVLLGGACTSVLMSGQTIFNNSTSSADAQMNSDIVQTYLTHFVPRATGVSQLASNSETKPTTGSCIYFDNDQFIIRTNGVDHPIDSVVDFTYHLKKAGETDFARPQFVYTVELANGSSYSSGFVLGNLQYVESTNPAKNSGAIDFVNEISVKTYPICFSGNAS